MTRSRKRLLTALAILFVALVTFRIALPGIIKRQLNERLDAMPGYTGHIDDVDLWLVRGAYTIDRIVLQKESTTAPVPFVDVERIDLSIQWRELFRGSVVGQIKAYRPILHFTNGPDATDDQAGTGVDWRQTVQDMFPLQINRFAVYDGEIHFADFSTAPPVDLEIRNIQAEARNLTNSDAFTDTLFATVDATGDPLGLGHFRLHADVDPYSNEPTFDLDLRVFDVELKGLNPFLSAYAGFDAESGTLELATELACKDGHLEGYVKPTLTDARVFNLKEEVVEDREDPARVAWEGIVGVARTLMQNPDEDQIASRIPIEGTLSEMEPKGWPAVFSMLGNAYIKALFAGIDGDVSLEGGVIQSASADDRREERREERERRRAERKRNRN